MDHISTKYNTISLSMLFSCQKSDGKFLFLTKSLCLTHTHMQSGVAVLSHPSYLWNFIKQFVMLLSLLQRAQIAAHPHRHGFAGALSLPRISRGVTLQEHTLSLISLPWALLPHTDCARRAPVSSAWHKHTSVVCVSVCVWCDHTSSSSSRSSRSDASLLLLSPLSPTLPHTHIHTERHSHSLTRTLWLPVTYTDTPPFPLTASAHAWFMNNDEGPGAYVSGEVWSAEWEDSAVREEPFELIKAPPL